MEPHNALVNPFDNLEDGEDTSLAASAAAPQPAILTTYGASNTEGRPTFRSSLIATNTAFTVGSPTAIQGDLGGPGDLTTVGLPTSSRALAAEELKFFVTPGPNNTGQVAYIKVSTYTRGSDGHITAEADPIDAIEDGQVVPFPTEFTQALTTFRKTKVSGYSPPALWFKVSNGIAFTFSPNPM